MWNKSFTVLRVLCHISHTCSRSLLERECEWLRLPYQFSTSSPSSDCFRSSLARTEQKTHLSVTMITQDNVKRNYSQDIKLYNNHHDIYISPIFPSSWLPSVKHMRLYGCGEFSLFSQLDPPPPIRLPFFSDDLIHLSLNYDWPATSSLAASHFPGFSDLSESVPSFLCGLFFHVFLLSPPFIISSWYQVLRSDNYNSISS